MQNILKYVDIEVLEVLNILNEHNYKAYIVGGAVRDIIMKRQVNDFDISTSALPVQTLELFQDLGYQVKTNGIKHGTVEVMYNNHYIEITSFRIDGEYLDNRHPQNVEFTSSFEFDAARRDFTMNAIGLDKSGKLYDYYGGIKDIKLHIIRTVGDPIKRFSEDSLRILRAIRFSTTLGFSIDDSTKKAMIANFSHLDRIASERIYQEISKIFKGRYFEMILPYINIIAYIMKSDKIDDNIIKFSHYNERLAYALKNRNDLKDVYLSGIEKRNILACYKYQNNDFSEYEIKLLLNKYGYVLTKMVLTYNTKLHNKSNKYLEDLENLKYTCCNIKQLAINGNDLMKIGIKGKQIGIILTKLLEKVMTNDIENKKTALLEAVESNL